MHCLCHISSSYHFGSSSPTTRYFSPFPSLSLLLPYSFFHPLFSHTYSCGHPFNTRIVTEPLRSTFSHLLYHAAYIFRTSDAAPAVFITRQKDLAVWAQILTTFEHMDPTLRRVKDRVVYDSDTWQKSFTATIQLLIVGSPLAVGLRQLFSTPFMQQTLDAYCAGIMSEEEKEKKIKALKVKTTKSLISLLLDKLRKLWQLHNTAANQSINPQLMNNINQTIVPSGMGAKDDASYRSNNNNTKAFGHVPPVGTWDHYSIAGISNPAQSIPPSWAMSSPTARPSTRSTPPRVKVNNVQVDRVPVSLHHPLHRFLTELIVAAICHWGLDFEDLFDHSSQMKPTSSSSTTAASPPALTQASSTSSQTMADQDTTNVASDTLGTGLSTSTKDTPMRDSSSPTDETKDKGSDSQGDGERAELSSLEEPATDDDGGNRSALVVRRSSSPSSSSSSSLASSSTKVPLWLRVSEASARSIAYVSLANARLYVLNGDSVASQLHNLHRNGIRDRTLDVDWAALQLTAVRVGPDNAIAMLGAKMGLLPYLGVGLNEEMVNLLNSVREAKAVRVEKWRDNTKKDSGYTPSDRRDMLVSYFPSWVLRSGATPSRPLITTTSSVPPAATSSTPQGESGTTMTDSDTVNGSGSTESKTASTSTPTSASTDTSVVLPTTLSSLLRGWALNRVSWGIDKTALVIERFFEAIARLYVARPLVAPLSPVDAAVDTILHALMSKELPFSKLNQEVEGKDDGHETVGTKELQKIVDSVATYVPATGQTTQSGTYFHLSNISSRSFPILSLLIDLSVHLPHFILSLLPFSLSSSRCLSLETFTLELFQSISPYIYT